MYAENNMVYATIDDQSIVISLTAVGQYMELLGVDNVEECLTMIATMTDPGILNTQTGANAYTTAYAQTRHDALKDYNQTGMAALVRPIDPQTGSLVPDGHTRTRELLQVDTDITTSTYEQEARQIAMRTMARIQLPAKAAPQVSARTSDLDDYLQQIRTARDDFARALIKPYLHQSEEEHR